MDETTTPFLAVACDTPDYPFWAFGAQEWYRDLGSDARFPGTSLLLSGGAIKKTKAVEEAAVFGLVFGSNVAEAEFAENVVASFIDDTDHIVYSDRVTKDKCWRSDARRKGLLLSVTDEGVYGEVHGKGFKQLSWLKNTYCCSDINIYIRSVESQPVDLEVSLLDIVYGNTKIDPYRKLWDLYRESPTEFYQALGDFKLFVMEGFSDYSSICLQFKEPIEPDFSLLVKYANQAALPLYDIGRISSPDGRECLVPYYEFQPLPKHWRKLN